MYLNFGSAALKKVLNAINDPFWKDVVEYLIYFSKKYVTPDERICDESIFNLNCIKFKKKCALLR